MVLISLINWPEWHPSKVPISRNLKRKACFERGLNWGLKSSMLTITQLRRDTVMTQKS